MPQKKKHTLAPEKWVEKYSDQLYQYARFRINNNEQAMDLVQDTFLSAIKAKGSFEGRSTEKTWLVSILKRKIIDQYRKKAVHKEDNIIDQQHEEASGFNLFQTDGQMKGFWQPDHLPQLVDFNTINQIDNNEFILVLNKCMDTLPERLSAVFSMRVIDEIETDDVCKELEITSSNLWVMLHRARAKMRECLEKFWLSSY